MVLKNARVWFLSPTVRRGRGPQINWSFGCVFLTSLVIGYNFVWMMMRFFPPLFWAKLLESFPWNFKFYTNLYKNVKDELKCREKKLEKYVFLLLLYVYIIDQNNYFLRTYIINSEEGLVNKFHESKFLWAYIKNDFFQCKSGWC